MKKIKTSVRGWCFYITDNMSKEENYNLQNKLQTSSHLTCDQCTKLCPTYTPSTLFYTRHNHWVIGDDKCDGYLNFITLHSVLTTGMLQQNIFLVSMVSNSQKNKPCHHIIAQNSSMAFQFLGWAIERQKDRDGVGGCRWRRERVGCVWVSVWEREREGLWIW